MSETSLKQQFAEIMKENELLAKENRLYDSFLERHAQKSGGEVQDKKTPVGRKLKGAQQQELTAYQKYNIALQEHDFRSKQLKQLEHKAVDDINLLKAIIENIQIRINEMRRETYEFKRDVMIGGANEQTGHVMSERVIRYFEEREKQKAALIEKIKLKNAALKTLRMKMDGQVKHKEEQGDSLHSIDFHQLQIKNSQFNQKIKERNTELMKLKMTTGSTVQILNDTKRQLQDLMSHSEKIRKDIDEREQTRSRLQEELSRVTSEVEKEQVKNSKFRIQQSNPDMPQVLDYINQKSELHDLEGAIRNLQRKLEITEFAARRAKTVMKSYHHHQQQQQHHLAPLGGGQHGFMPAAAAAQQQFGRMGSAPAGGRAHFDTKQR